ncbi:MAG: DUF3160 domain-containing protein [bacterium]|nr:DUF3160 domain-containing protein [bacterium]
MKRWSILLSAILLIAAACTSDDEPAPTTAPPPSTTATPATTTTVAAASTTSLPPIVVPTVAQSSFGDLTEVPLLAGGAPFAGSNSPTSLSNVYVPDWVDAYLSANDATTKLVDNGFVVVPGSTRHFHHVYEGASYDAYPVYVTTDAAYHVWHLAFDKILREAEQQSLLPVLDEMVASLVHLARAQESELAGTELAEAASRVTQFYEAAATVLELDVGPIGPLAQQEVELIMDASELTLSPTTGGDENSGFITTKVDYSLFRPRGHYTRNADLERYFRAMSQLGNNAFLVTKNLDLGILASRVLLADPAVIEQWRQIYEPTSWLVGAADDYTPFELGAVVEEVVPTGWSDMSVFADPTTVAAVGDSLLALRTVEINPEAASLRIMGSRFVIDSFILDQLVAPNVENDTASPLDIAAAFGSEWAYGVQEAFGATAATGYDEQMDAMQELIASRTVADWGGTVYDAWLYAVAPMWQSHGDEYPNYMQTEAWDAKSHQTGFGSYTELKHDTILYTKQAVAEGGGEEPPVPPRHWVEPEPVAFGRLAALTSLMRTGLESRDLLPDEYSGLLTELEDFYLWLQGIASDELAGLPISEEDNQELSWIGSTLEAFWVRTSDSDIAIDDGPDSHAALIADVMRNQGEVLELGTGYIDNIFVIVSDDEGGFQIATGGVYSYYEFWNDQRLTDEEWRDWLELGRQPPRPTWQGSFLAGEPPAPTGLEAGLFCRDLNTRGFPFWDAAIYWVSEGSTSRMDADGNGIPCETVYPEEQIDSFLVNAADFDPGLLCAELPIQDDPDEYLRVIAYWMLEGTPDRMDVDGNGIPCETVFSAESISVLLESIYNREY